VALASLATPPAVSETPGPGTDGALPEPPVIELPAGTKRERWEWLRNRVLTCPVCRAHTHGNSRVVFGVGNIDAEIFFCGEAPGREEEQQGEPFVGPAGKLLTKMIVAMGLRREDVYIGNILNWRPEMEGRLTGASIQQVGNRPPTQEEMRFGLPYLRAQVEVVAPRVIVALGTTAAEGLLGLGSFKGLGSVRGRWHTFNGTPLMVTYHPSYLLRNASNQTKRVAWEDLLKVMEKVGLPISERQRGYFQDSAARNP
jgi:DNA polymerase